MRHHRSLIIIIALTIIAMAGLVVLVLGVNGRDDDCEAVGGVYANTDDGSICLNPDATIPVP